MPPAPVRAHPVSAACLMEEAVGRRAPGREEPGCARALGSLRHCVLKQSPTRAARGLQQGLLLLPGSARRLQLVHGGQVEGTALVQAHRGSAGPWPPAAAASPCWPRYSRPPTLLLAWGVGQAWEGVRGGAPSPGGAWPPVDAPPLPGASCHCIRRVHLQDLREEPVRFGEVILTEVKESSANKRHGKDDPEVGCRRSVWRGH